MRHVREKAGKTEAYSADDIVRMNTTALGIMYEIDNQLKELPLDGVDDPEKRAELVLARMDILFAAITLINHYVGRELFHMYEAKSAEAISATAKEQGVSAQFHALSDDAKQRLHAMAVLSKDEMFMQASGDQVVNMMRKGITVNVNDAMKHALEIIGTKALQDAGLEAN